MGKLDRRILTSRTSLDQTDGQSEISLLNNKGRCQLRQRPRRSLDEIDAERDSAALRLSLGATRPPPAVTQDGQLHFPLAEAHRFCVARHPDVDLAPAHGGAAICDEVFAAV